MSRRTLLTIAGVLVVVIAAAGATILLYLNSLMQFKPLAITYSTEQTSRPANAPCLGGDESPGIAKEIINLETDIIYVAGGTNAMPDNVWADYRFLPPILKNSTRNLLFEGSCFFRSPGVPATCEGDACFAQQDIAGYTWYALTTVEGQSCFPDASGCSGDSVSPGYVSVTTIAKCHEITFPGPVIYELSDGHGNRYVMHATGTGIPDVTGPTLPAGWTLQAREIAEPLTLYPFGGGNSCYYNVLRDNLVQSYHQYHYAESQYPPATPAN